MHLLENAPKTKELMAIKVDIEQGYDRVHFEIFFCMICCYILVFKTAFLSLMMGVLSLFNVG